jgi:hypothetical protein
VIRNSTHGKCTIQDLQRETTAYLNANSRKNEINHQLLVCLTNSVDNATKRILASEEQVYMSSGEPCGVTYLKLLIKNVEVDMRATASHINRLLTQQDVYMVREPKNNVIKFNKYVRN